MLDPFTLAAIIGSTLGILASSKQRKNARATRAAQPETKVESSSKDQINEPPTHHQPQAYRADQYCSIDLYHGTPNKENVGRILTEGGSFQIGGGNINGSGMYMTKDFRTAKYYAGRDGGILKLRLDCPLDQIADYNAVLRSREFKDWKNNQGIRNEGDAISSYCTNVLKKRFLRVDLSTYIALSQRTNEDERIRFQGINIVGCTDSKGRNLK